jgi:hypothetical protein
MSRADLTQVETCDKHMNIQGADGTAYRNRDGVITLPQAEAAKAVAAGVPGVKPYRKTWGGFGEGKLRKPYAERQG